MAVKVGIIGAAGYTGGEMIRILLNHPDVEIAYANSDSNGGKLVSDVHTDLLGVTDLKFSEGYSFDQVDALMICRGHGQTKTFIEANTIPAHIKIIDLSNDYRLTGSDSNIDQDFVYGLPEMQKDVIAKATNIANPGCFATCIQLGLLPLAKAGLIKSDIHVSAMTGSTGAGQSLSQTSHFSWRNNNISCYKMFSHQHLGEIKQNLADLQDGLSPVVNFVPYRGNFTRGILASIYLDFDQDLESAQALFDDYYKDHPFVFRSEKNIDLKQVVNSNRNLIYLEKHDNKLLIISATDNLIKGASGTAVQNMNLMFGLDEMAGLGIKSIAF